MGFREAALTSSIGRGRRRGLRPVRQNVGRGLRQRKRQFHKIGAGAPGSGILRKRDAYHPARTNPELYRYPSKAFPRHRCRSVRPETARRSGPTALRHRTRRAASIHPAAWLHTRLSDADAKLSGSLMRTLMGTRATSDHSPRQAASSPRATEKTARPRPHRGVFQGRILREPRAPKNSFRAAAQLLGVARKVVS